jgi:hypothetical protein
VQPTHPYDNYCTRLWFRDSDIQPRATEIVAGTEQLAQQIVDFKVLAIIPHQGQSARMLPSHARDFRPPTPRSEEGLPKPALQIAGCIPLLRARPYIEVAA